MKFNIPKDNSDPFFRYKRHQIEIQHINKKNGLVVLDNFNVIAKELNRPVNDVIKYFRKKLGMSITISNSTFQIKSSGGGGITVDVLEKILESYIEKFVLCKKCGNPETSPLNFQCLACGNNN
jgi:translation initiation factor 5